MHCLYIISTYALLMNACLPIFFNSLWFRFFSLKWWVMLKLVTYIMYMCNIMNWMAGYLFQLAVCQCRSIPRHSNSTNNSRLFILHSAVLITHFYNQLHIRSMKADRTWSSADGLESRLSRLPFVWHRAEGNDKLKFSCPLESIY